MAEQTKTFRGLLTKRPFFRISPDNNDASGRILHDISERGVTYDKVVMREVTQADFVRELDTESHAINDRNIYKTYWQKDEDGKFYEADFPRYAFPFQHEILDDRLARLTGNDIQFDLADIEKKHGGWDVYDMFKAGWADKSMERAWHFVAKSVLSTGDGAFVGILDNGTFRWKVLSYSNGDTLYPHYDRRTGRMKLFARAYSDYNDNGDIQRYIDVWDDKYYYRLSDSVNKDDETEKSAQIADFEEEGYAVEEMTPHGFNRVPIAYKRCDEGPCWSAVQELIEHYEAAFSRLAQSNHEFGLPILGLYGDGQEMQELATSDMSYASKIFLIPSDGKAEFLNRQDASGAYKTELDELRKKIYEGAMVVKAPELKSGDTPAAAIKLLYSDSYNKALLESQEYDECVGDMVELFKWGYGIECENRIDFTKTRIVYYVRPYIPINDQEVVNNLSLAVQNGFCSKQTASEKFYFATPNEWDRILQEKHDNEMHEILIEEKRLEMQNEENLDYQEDLSEIQTDQQVAIINAQTQTAKESNGDDDEKVHKVISRKGSLNTGRGRGRPNRSGKQWDENRNFLGRNGWTRWNQTR